MTPIDQLPPDSLAEVLDDAPPEEQYWAKKQASDVISECNKQEEEFFQALRRRGLLGMWKMQWAQYYGQNPDGPGMETQMINIAGEDGELLAFRLQKVRQYITRQIQLAAGERAAFQCHAVNNDYQTRAQINTCDSIIEYVYREAHAERKERDILESDSNFGYGLGWVRWDAEKGDEITFTEEQPDPNGPPGAKKPVQVTKRSGAPTVGVLYPWECVQSRNAKEHLWRIGRERTSRWELIATYPELAQKIRAIRGLDEYVTERLFGYDDTSDQDADDVVVKHFYHARCAAMPNGRYLGYVGDVMLWDLDCPVLNGLPIQELCSEKFIGSSFGYATAWDLAAPNQLIDQIASDTASNIATFGRPVIGMPQGSDYDVAALANGMRVITLPPSGEEPKAISFESIPEASKWALEWLTREMDGISGINAAAQGNPQSNVGSGTYAALLHSIAIEFQAPRQTAFDEYREGMANMMLDLVRQRAQAPFLIEVAGLEERPYLQEFTKDSLSGVKRVVVKTANPMMRSQAGRLEIFGAVKDIPNPADRASAIELITTGNSRDFAKPDRSLKMAITWENEQLAQGIQVPITEWDNHPAHVQEHLAEWNSRREGMIKDAQALAMFNLHMQDHQMAWSMAPPDRCALVGMEVSPTMQMLMQGVVAPPANQNAAPEGAMAGGQPTRAAGPVANTNGAGVTPSDPAAAAGAKQPEPAQPAQPPGGQAQNPGEAA